MNDTVNVIINVINNAATTIRRLRLDRLGAGQGRDQQGAAAIEAAIGVPAFVLFVGLIIYGGRSAATHQALESAAADAARSASIARDAATAQTDARQAAQVELADQHLHCRSVTVHVDTAGFATPVGQPSTVAVTVSCQLDLADLTVPGVPGSRVLTATVTSPLDTWRERS